MKKASALPLILIAILCSLLAGCGWMGRIWSAAAPSFRTKSVSRGDITLTVTSSGTVQPVQSVQVGSFVSGPIEKVYVDFNSRVAAGEKLAEIDTRVYRAAVEREEASLEHRKAELERITTLLEHARRNEARAMELRSRKKTYISASEVDRYVYECKSLEAQKKLAEASIREATASLNSARTNLGFTTITSPVDGLIIDRKVDSGQTLTSQFQTPVMFVVSPDLDKRVYVYASVDEADIGLIRDAKDREQPVTFSVSAYPTSTFTGHVAQVRLNPTTVQNVTTYTVVVEATNAELKLLPGMTANLKFQIAKRENVLRIPNAALRFHPKPEQVREKDRPLVEGLLAGKDDAEEKDTEKKDAGTKDAEDKDAANSATAKDDAEKKDGETESPESSTSTADLESATVNSPGEPLGGLLDPPAKRHVWIVEGKLLAAVEVLAGMSDNFCTEVLSGALKEGQELVIGLQVDTGVSF